MSKPSEEIQKRFKEFVDSRQELREALDTAPDVFAHTTVASATMIQIILDWIDENFTNPKVQ